MASSNANQSEAQGRSLGREVERSKTVALAQSGGMPSVRRLNQADEIALEGRHALRVVDQVSGERQAGAAAAQTASKSPGMGSSYSMLLRWMTSRARSSARAIRMCSRVHAERVASAAALPPKTVSL
jgi:hypothetical protein